MRPCALAESVGDSNVRYRGQKNAINETFIKRDFIIDGTLVGQVWKLARPVFVFLSGRCKWILTEDSPIKILSMQPFHLRDYPLF